MTIIIFSTFTELGLTSECDVYRFMTTKVYSCTERVNVIAWLKSDRSMAVINILILAVRGSTLDIESDTYSEG